MDPFFEATLIKSFSTTADEEEPVFFDGWLPDDSQEEIEHPRVTLEAFIREVLNVD